MNMLKRFLSLALAIVLVLGCVPTLAFAEEQSVTAAKIGEATFASLEAAFAAAQDGDVITVQSDLELSAGIVNTKQVTLDLNGKTVSYTSDVPGEDMITNRGKLTITDTDGGKLTYVNTDATAVNVTVSTISTEAGSELIVENGTIENKSVKADGSSIYPFAIDVLTNGSLGDVSVTINDGTVYSDYIAIRQFNNGTACKNMLTVNDGYIYGGKRGIQTHMANNAAYTTITGGKVEAGDYALCLFATEAPAIITGGEFVGMVYSATSGIVYGGSFNDEYVSEYIAAGCDMQENADGTYGVSISLPSATISYISNPDLTFAMNFKADEATEAQLAYYGSWYADFVLTSNKDIVMNADGSADGWLSGQYDAWSENWVNVPFGNKAPVTIKAGESLKIMALAAEMLDKPGLKFTYGEIYESVKDFDCGMFLDAEFLAANPDIEVTLELRIYNPANEAQSIAVSDTFVFNYEKPELPNATVSYISNPELTFALNFKADEATMQQLAYYGNWYADFVLTSNKDIVMNADGSADGWLSGQYDAWSENWVNVPFGNKAPVTIKAGESLKIMEFAAQLMGEPGLKYTCAEVYDVVKDFDCGMLLDAEFLAANPDIKVTLELRIYNPKDESESYSVSDLYVFTLPELPSATVSYISNPELTFALNFKADAATEAQLGYYGAWYADFVLTSNKDIVMNADGSADGWLSGQYDAWSENWVNVPFGNKAPVTLKAGESLKIMEFAAQLMGEPGLKYTYAEVYEAVKDFDCGMLLDADFLAANPDIEITLELRLYNPKDESESYSVSDLYVFTLPELPSATVSYISNPELTFALNFKADAATEAQLGYYGAWYADFVLTSNKDIVMNADGSADGWLSGQYDAWSENWVNVPFGNKAPVTLKANESLKIMEFAAQLMGEPGLKYTYAEVYEAVKDFDCGMFLTPEFLAANPDIEVTLELRMYNPKDESESYVIGDTYVFTLPEYVAYNETTDTLYTTLADAIAAAQAGDKINLLKDVTIDEQIDVNTAVTVDLGGFKVTATSKKAFAVYADATFQNGTIEAAQRAIDTRTAVELNLTDLELTATSMKYGNPQPLTIGGSDNGTVVNMTNVTIEAGIDGYSIITFVETELNITDSTLNGFSNIYVKDGSAGSVITLTNTALTSITNDPLDMFAAIVTEANDITVTADEASTLTADDGAFGFTAERTNVEITFAGDITAHEIVMGWNENLTVIVPEALTAQIEEEALATEATETEGLVLIVLPEYVAYNETTDTLYTTLADAVAAAQAGDKINLLKDVTIDEQIDVNTAVTVDLGGFKVTATSKKAFAVYADATFQNGAIEAAQRAIDTRTAVELNLSDLELIATSLKYGNAQPLTVGGSDNGTVVNMTNVTIEAGIDGYSIITFVETELNITDSTLNGFSNIYVKDGSAGSVITLTNTALTSITNDPLDMFAAIVTEANDITVTADAASSITADDGAFGFTAERTNVEITFAGDITANTVVMGWNESLTVIVPEALTAQIEEEALATEATETEGLVLITLKNYVAHNIQTDKYYETVSGAMLEAEDGQTVEVIKDCTDRVITIKENTTLDLNGFTVTANYVACYGDLVDYTDDNSGLLIVTKTRFFIREDNAQLPVRDGEGYRFVEIIKYNQAVLNGGTKYAFQPLFEENAHALLANGIEATGVTIRVLVSWKDGSDIRTQEFLYTDEYVNGFIDSYKPATGKYSKMFTLTLNGAEDFEDLTFVATVVSEVGVSFRAD